MPEARQRSDESPAAGPARRYVVSVLRYAAVAAILYYLVLQVSHNWQQIKEYEWTIAPLPFLLSLLVGLAAFFIMAAIWVRWLLASSAATEIVMTPV